MLVQQVGERLIGQLLQAATCVSREKLKRSQNLRREADQLALFLI